MVNINDYLISQTGFDCQAQLARWAEILPETFTIWLVNRFANVFIIAEDGSVHCLDVVSGTLERVADSRDQFADLMDIPQSANNWLMIPLVDHCVKAGISLQPGQCYSFKVPPLFGEYGLGNVAPVDVAENYAFLADIWSRTKNMTDGTSVRLVIGPAPKVADDHGPQL